MPATIKEMESVMAKQKLVRRRCFLEAPFSGEQINSEKLNEKYRDDDAGEEKETKEEERKVANERKEEALSIRY